MLVRKLVITAFLFGISLQASAAPIPDSPDRQTSWGLYVDSREAFELKTGTEGKKILFVDVRDPIEIMFTGFTDTVDINIPFLISNPTKWNEKKSVYAMEPNKDFESDIVKALNDRGLTKDDKIILMCRSGGERGAPSAKALDGKGFKQVYVVTDGFEGDTVKEGPKKNWRLVNGWKSSGLPWGYKLNKQKMYFE
jgi:rhodanese-related sulfurtransferase